MKKVQTKKKSETLASRAENIKGKLFWEMKLKVFLTILIMNMKNIIK